MTTEKKTPGKKPDASKPAKPAKVIRLTPEPQPAVAPPIEQLVDRAVADAIAEGSRSLTMWLNRSLDALAEHQRGEQQSALERARMDHEFRMRLLERR